MNRRDLSDLDRSGSYLSNGVGGSDHDSIFGDETESGASEYDGYYQAAQVGRPLQHWNLPPTYFSSDCNLG